MQPAAEAVETIAGEQDLWTYAVAAAALLHDPGKPVADQRVALFDAGGRPLGDWAPWLGAISAEAAWYRVTFVQGRRYRLHERLPALLAHLIVPAWVSLASLVSNGSYDHAPRSLGTSTRRRKSTRPDQVSSSRVAW